MIHKRRRLLLAKAESTYNTDPTLSPSTNAIRVKDFTVSPHNPRKAERDIVSNVMSTPQKLSAGQLMQVTAQVEIVGVGGSDTADTEPDFGVLLKGCGMVVATDATPSQEYAEYTFSSDPADHKSLYFKCYRDGRLWEIGGARGSFEITGKVGEIVMASFTFIGHLKGYSDVVLSTITPSYQNPGRKPPVCIGGSVAFAGYALKASEISFQSGVSVVTPENINEADGYDEVVIAGPRQVTASVDPLAATKATHDFQDDFDSNTQGTLTTGFFGSANNLKFRIQGENASIQAPPDEGDREGMEVDSLSFDLDAPTSGDGAGEFAIRFGYAA